ncbi:response regulator (plasmid) [Pelagibacterium nitratireducens]|jgi:DNA-binding NtrC family response regulator|uniref:Response regulator n=1 Tax=Pelagibacterium nitratireducens TaxID=1046114 RepID=A0ABZ2I4X9_9HYPH|tara:strand:- start:4505 stop:4879 length:375 start_codon:yes stop_codon:yes gene_type:complete
MNAAESTTILIVEDEILILIDLAMSLRSAGFDVLEASSADAAIELLEKHPEIRAVITDIDMPGSMNGLALAHAVFEKWPPCRLIVVSGHHFVSIEELPSGARFFSKPADPIVLNSALEEMGVAA